jgi:hypothetical protein
MSDAHYGLDWYAGSSAQVEIFSPRAKRGKLYQLKYTPALRATIRPPVQDRPLGAGELKPIDDQLDVVVEALKVRAGRFAPPRGEDPGPVPDPQAGEVEEAEADEDDGDGDGDEADERPIQKMELLGKLLYDLILPRYIQVDLRPPGQFLEIGMDEALLSYPWELMHDGEDFLCLKHAVGRFVNGASAQPFDAKPAPSWGTRFGPLTILVIAVPESKVLPGRPLPWATKEAKAIVDALAPLPGIKVEVLPSAGKKATFNQVFQALSSGRYHIVHFCGHARFNDKDPYLSSLVLYDKEMTTGQVLGFFSKAPPVLCFINACESGLAKDGRKTFDTYGLARAFLETGTYLIGSRWEVADEVAATFAPQFYAALLKEGQPLGMAVQDARRACKEKAPDDFAWASYVFYGDPRVCFAPPKREDQVGAPGEYGIRFTFPAADQVIAQKAITVTGTYEHKPPEGTLCVFVVSEQDGRLWWPMDEATFNEAEHTWSAKVTFVAKKYSVCLVAALVTKDRAELVRYFRQLPGQLEAGGMKRENDYVFKPLTTNNIRECHRVRVQVNN